MFVVTWVHPWQSTEKCPLRLRRELLHQAPPVEQGQLICGRSGVESRILRLCVFQPSPCCQTSSERCPEPAVPPRKNCASLDTQIFSSAISRHSCKGNEQRHRSHCPFPLQKADIAKKIRTCFFQYASSLIPGCHYFRIRLNVASWYC